MNTQVTCHICRKPFEPLRIFGKRISACCSDQCTDQARKQYGKTNKTARNFNHQTP